MHRSRQQLACSPPTQSRTSRDSINSQQRPAGSSTHQQQRQQHKQERQRRQQAVSAGSSHSELLRNVEENSQQWLSLPPEGCRSLSHRHQHSSNQSCRCKIPHIGEAKQTQKTLAQQHCWLLAGAAASGSNRERQHRNAKQQPQLRTAKP